MYYKHPHETWFQKGLRVADQGLTGENDRFHVRENASTCRVCTGAEGQCNAMTLKDALLTALNTGRSMTGQYTVTYDTTTNKLVVGNLDDASRATQIYAPKDSTKSLGGLGTRGRESSHHRSSFRRSSEAPL